MVPNLSQWAFKFRSSIHFMRQPLFYMSNFQYKNNFSQVNVHICISEHLHAASIFTCRCRCTSPNTAIHLEMGYVHASMAVLGFWPGAGLDGHEVSGLPGALRGDFRFPFRTVSSSLGLKVRGTKPSASATSTIHSGPGKKKQTKHLNLKLQTSDHVWWSCVQNKACLAAVPV